MSYRRIMVPLDGSAASEHALPMALNLANLSGAGVELLHVHESVTFPDLGPAAVSEEAWQSRRRASAYLDDVTGRVRGACPSVRVNPTLLQGHVAEVLRETAAASRPDLVVMTPRGPDGPSHFWIGSVAAELVKSLPGPVILARPGEGPVDLTCAPPPPLRRVLIALDGSRFAERVLGPASAVGSLAGAEFGLVRVVDPAAGLEAEAESYLREVADRAFPGGATHRVARAADPAGAILADAKDYGADLIAMTTHGHSGLVPLLLGSVADAVARRAEVPVLLFRPADGGGSEG